MFYNRHRALTDQTSPTYAQIWLAPSDAEQPRPHRERCRVPAQTIFFLMGILVLRIRQICPVEKLIAPSAGCCSADVVGPVVGYCCLGLSSCAAPVVHFRSYFCLPGKRQFIFLHVGRFITPVYAAGFANIAARKALVHGQYNNALLTSL